VCNFFLLASYSKMLYEAISTIENSDSLRGGLDPDATGREGPALSKLLQDGGGFYGDERCRDHPASFAGRSAPVQKNGRSGWAWVLASLLMVAKESDNGRSMKTGKVEMRAPKAATDSTFPKIGMSIPRIVGDSVREEVFCTAIQGDVGIVAPIMGKPATGIIPDTDRVEMGTPALVKADPIRPGDTMPTVPQATTRTEELTGFAGGIVVGVKIDSAIDILTDTVKQVVSDTLAALGWRPAPALNIYPNPVSRGGAIQLAWKTQPGQYQLTLMNTRGQLIAERMLDVGGAGQVDSWEIPASLAAGIYVLRLVRGGGAGGAAVCTREVIVR
jgi:hypothetical protein